MRTKEEAHDYRYFPEPDLVPVHIRSEWLEELKASLPELPLAKKVRFVEQYELSDYDAMVLSDSRRLADYFERCVEEYGSPKTICNWIANDLLRVLNDKGMDIAELQLPPAHVASLVRMVDEGKVNVAGGREILEDMIESGKDPESVLNEKGLAQISDESALIELARKVVEQNPKIVADWKAGKKAALNALIGPVMRETKGKGNPQVVRKVLQRVLESL